MKVHLQFVGTSVSSQRSSLHIIHSPNNHFLVLCAVLRHPDKNHGNEDEAKVAFQRVHAAYQLLMKGPGYDSDEEEFDDMDFDEAFSYFMDMYVTSPYPHPITTSSRPGDRQ